jgi:hypothetical protein
MAVGVGCTDHELNAVQTTHRFGPAGSTICMNDAPSVRITGETLVFYVSALKVPSTAH